MALGTPPIIVTDQVATPAIWTVIRYALSVVGGFITNMGWASADTVQTAIGVVLAVGPIILGAVIAIRNKQKLIRAASSADDRVAQVK